MRSAPALSRKLLPAGILADLSGRSHDHARAQNNYVDQYYQDASFIKLREVSATYTIPERGLRGTRASFTLAARELHTWTKFRGLDPEGHVRPIDATSGHTAAQSNSRYLQHPVVARMRTVDMNRAGRARPPLLATVACQDVTTLQQSNPGQLSSTTAYAPLNAQLLVNGAAEDF